MALELEEEYGSYKNFIYRTRKPRNSLVQKMGVNDAPFMVSPTINGIKIKHPAYIAWQSMLNRCYDSKYKEKYPTYVGVTCCTEWLLFTTFARWFKQNYIDGYHLDKDLLYKSNKIYSPKTCIFVPPDINNFLTTSASARGTLPLGVSMDGTSFRASIKSKHICSVKDSLTAHRLWQKAKLEQAIAFNFPPLQRVIDQLKFEIENNLETTSL
jgi:hypothetical protein